MLTLAVDGCAAAIQCGGTAVDQMDQTVGSLALQLFTADALARLRAQ